MPTLSARRQTSFGEKAESAIVSPDHQRSPERQVRVDAVWECETCATPLLEEHLTNILR